MGWGLEPVGQLPAHTAIYTCSYNHEVQFIIELCVFANFITYMLQRTWGTSHCGFLAVYLSVHLLWKVCEFIEMLLWQISSVARIN